MIDATLEVWCGAIKGASLTSPFDASNSPAIEAIALSSRARSGSSGGRILGRREAIMLLPAPGGPRRSM